MARAEEPAAQLSVIYGGNDKPEGWNGKNGNVTLVATKMVGLVRDISRLIVTVSGNVNPHPAS